MKHGDEDTTHPNKTQQQPKTKNDKPDFLGLYYLLAVTVTFILNLTPIFVLFLSIIFLREAPSHAQLLGIIVTLCGVLTKNVNTALISREIFGIILTFVSGISWTAYMILARYHLKGGKEIAYYTNYLLYDFGIINTSWVLLPS